MSFVRIGVTIVLAAGLARIQAQGAPQSEFEVASVKPSGPDSQRGSSGGPGSRDPGQYHFGRATLENLIVVAYDVHGFQISSKTPLDKDQFDVVAKVPAGATRAEFCIMLQNLLAERFRLKLHHESREFQAYELVVAKNGPKLKESKTDAAPADDNAHPRFSADGVLQLPPNRPVMSTMYSGKDGVMVARMTAQQQTMESLARVLSRPNEAGSPVVDKTGLTGVYDFHLEFAPSIGAPVRAIPGSPGGDPSLPDLFSALTKQLGLHLVAKKLPFDVLLIESFEKTPVEN